MLWLFNFREDQIFVDFVGFLSMIVYKVLYTQCIRYNICSACFLNAVLEYQFVSYSVV